jgi:hypothetical protein
MALQKIAEYQPSGITKACGRRVWSPDTRMKLLWFLAVGIAAASFGFFFDGDRDAHPHPALSNGGAAEGGDRHRRN